MISDSIHIFLGIWNALVDVVWINSTYIWPLCIDSDKD